MVPRSYKKYVAEGRNVVTVSILLAIALRVIYFYCADPSTLHSDISGGYLWEPIAHLFVNPFVSLLASTLCVVFIAFLLAHINTKYVLIRRKTLLHLAFAALLFSCHPSFILMNPGYVSAIFILLAISALFDSYATNKRAISALKVSFVLALGSLFAPSMLLYFPVFWIGLAIMRSFSFKAFLASLFGIFTVYFPAYSYFLYSRHTDTFLSPFTSLALNKLSDFPFAGFDYATWGVIAFAVILLGIIFTYNYMTNYKDKIRIRALISFLNLIVIFASVLMLFLNIDVANDLYILIATVILLLSHFFALAEERWIALLFYTSILIYLIIATLTFLPIS